MSTKTHVRMVHSETGQVWDAPRRYVTRAEEKGFQLADAEPAKTTEPTQITAPPVEPTPSRVTDAERSGKNRTTTGD